MTSGTAKTVLAFDVYGTLLSTESIAKKLALHFGEERAASISAKWRLYQLEYTWRANSMNKYEPFSTITQKSLQHALKEQGLTLSSQDSEDMMLAYNSLSTFPDVQAGLDKLSEDNDIDCVYFTQGTQAMVSASVTQSPELSPYTQSIFKATVCCSESTRKFKPAPETYQYLIEQLGRTNYEGVWLVSGNPFDITGAREMGMEAAWVDRAGNGWVDCLGEPDLRPTVIAKDIEEVVEKVKAFKR